MYQLCVNVSTEFFTDVLEILLVVVRCIRKLLVSAYKIITPFFLFIIFTKIFLDEEDPEGDFDSVASLTFELGQTLLSSPDKDINMVVLWTKLPSAKFLEAFFVFKISCYCLFSFLYFDFRRVYIIRQKNRFAAVQKIS